MYVMYVCIYMCVCMCVCVYVWDMCLLGVWIGCVDFTLKDTFSVTVTLTFDIRSPIFRRIEVWVQSNYPPSFSSIAYLTSEIYQQTEFSGKTHRQKPLANREKLQINDSSFNSRPRSIHKPNVSITFTFFSVLVLGRLKLRVYFPKEKSAARLKSDVPSTVVQGVAQSAAGL